MKQYKVLSQKDKWYSGKFDPESLEKALNSYAQQGWQVVGCATASMPGIMGGSRDEMVIIMERDDNRQALEAERQRRLSEAVEKSFAAPPAPARKPTSTNGGEPEVYTL